MSVGSPRIAPTPSSSPSSASIPTPSSVRPPPPPPSDCVDPFRFHSDGAAQLRTQVAEPDEAIESASEPIALGWYAFALALYVALGYFLKSWVLNWIIGPLFLLIVLYLIPTAVRRLFQRERGG